MANYLTDDAVCLRVTDFSETSQIVALFTRRHGVVPMIAKGSKRQTKKNTMSGPLDLLTSGEVVFVPARGAAELSTLAGWELTDHRTLLRADLAGLNAAMLCAEVTTLLLHPHDPHEELFEELEAALGLLGTRQRMRAVAAYVKAALLAAGYAPQLESCQVCGKAVAGGGADRPLRFYSHAGGVTCGETEASRGCFLEGPGRGVMVVPGKIVVALSRLALPRALAANPPERAADGASLALAMAMQLSQVESVTDKRVRTRFLLPSIFGTGGMGRERIGRELGGARRFGARR